MAKPRNRMILIKDNALNFEITFHVLNHLGLLSLSFVLTEYTTERNKYIKHIREFVSTTSKTRVRRIDNG